jgi:hypothetical protein
MTKVQSPLGILFLHHDTNEVVEQNLLSIKSHNPCALLVTMSAGTAMAGGYALSATPEIGKLHQANPTRSTDWLVCSWFQQRKEECEKWWIVEWDTYSTESVYSYYQAVWNFPFVASNVQLIYRDPNWPWFKMIDQMPKEYRRYAMGATPFLYLLSDGALSRICSSLMANPFTAGNGELRFATVANKCGFSPCGFSPPNDHITWLNIHFRPKPGCICHPMKQLVTATSGSWSLKRKRLFGEKDAHPPPQ